MKTFRIKIIDFDGCPAAIEVQGEHENHAVSRALDQVRKWKAAEVPALQVMSVSEVMPEDQGGTET